MLCRLFFRALWSKRRQSTGHTWIKSRQVIVRVFCAGPLPWNGWPIYLPSPASQDPARIFCESGHSTYFWDSHQVGKRAAPLSKAHSGSVAAGPAQRAMVDCSGTPAHRLGHKINVCRTASNLWLLRRDLYQRISQEHSQGVAAESINRLIPAFEGRLRASQLNRI